ncbi:MAG: hypothetical protein ABIF92_00340 [archaeon]
MNFGAPKQFFTLKKEFAYYLKEYESAVCRFDYWKRHSQKSGQVSEMLNNSAKSAKVLLNSALLKYIMHLNFTEQSPKARDLKLQALVEGIVSGYEKNNLSNRIEGSKGRLVKSLLYSSLKKGEFLDLRHNPEKRTPEEMEKEIEYRHTVAKLFQHPGIAKDTIKVLKTEFSKIDN